MKIFGRKGKVAGAMAVSYALTLGAVGYAVAAPVTIGGLYTENAGAGCGSGSVCRVIFTGVPSGKQLEVQRVSCRITEQVNRLAIIKFGVRKADGQITREAYLPADLLGGEAGNFRHVVNSEVDLITRNVPPMFEVVSDLATTFSVACQISGRLTNVPS